MMLTKYLSAISRNMCSSFAEGGGGPRRGEGAALFREDLEGLDFVVSEHARYRHLKWDS